MQLKKTRETAQNTSKLRKRQFDSTCALQNNKTKQKNKLQVAQMSMDIDI